MQQVQHVAAVTLVVAHLCPSFSTIKRTWQLQDHQNVTGRLRCILFKIEKYYTYSKRAHGKKPPQQDKSTYWNMKCWQFKYRGLYKHAPNNPAAFYSYTWWMQQKCSSARSDRLGSGPSKPLALPVLAGDFFTSSAREAAKAFCWLHPAHAWEEPGSQNTSGSRSVFKPDLTSIIQKSCSKSEARMKTVQMSLCTAVAQGQICTATKLRIERGTPIDVIAS